MTTKSQRKKVILAKFERKEFMAQHGIKTSRQLGVEIRKRWRDAALDLPIEIRRAFLEMWWDRKPLGEIRNTLHLSTEQTMGIFNLNSKKITTDIVNRPENCI